MEWPKNWCLTTRAPFNPRCSHSHTHFPSILNPIFYISQSIGREVPSFLIFIEDKKETFERKKNKKVRLDFVDTEKQRLLKVIGKIKLKKKLLNIADHLRKLLKTIDEGYQPIKNSRERTGVVKNRHETKHFSKNRYRRKTSGNR